MLIITHGFLAFFSSILASVFVSNLIGLIRVQTPILQSALLINRVLAGMLHCIIY